MVAPMVESNLLLIGIAPPDEKQVALAGPGGVGLIGGLGWRAIIAALGGSAVPARSPARPPTQAGHGLAGREQDGSSNL